MGFDMDVDSLAHVQAARNAHLQRPSLLVVDDDSDTRHLVREILGQSFNVYEAGSKSADKSRLASARNV